MYSLGDVDQGFSYWPEAFANSPHWKIFSKLAHENFDRYGGEYYRAKVLYKELISAEGHRNYPLREAKCLRSSPDLMLPIGDIIGPDIF